MTNRTNAVLRPGAGVRFGGPNTPACSTRTPNQTPAEREPNTEPNTGEPNSLHGHETNRVAGRMTAVTMTERDLETAVMDLARILGWRRAHFRPAQTSRGWRTPVSGDGAGWPDLFLVRPPRIVVAELKAEKGRLTADQDAWLSDLAGSGINVHVWRPANLDDGSIVELLR